MKTSFKNQTYRERVLQFARMGESGIFLPPSPLIFTYSLAPIARTRSSGRKKPNQNAPTDIADTSFRQRIDRVGNYFLLGAMRIQNTIPQKTQPIRNASKMFMLESMIFSFLKNDVDI